VANVKDQIPQNYPLYINPYPANAENRVSS